ncbi:phage baseplate assembly protein V [Pseudomonas farris]
MFDAFVNQKLEPLIERLAELEAEIEDIRRRAENHNRIGIVDQVNPAAGLCKVKHGDLMTPWVKYMSPSAGEISETRHPSAGEQCLLINYGGGDGSAHSVALCGLISDQFPPASTEAQLHRRIYPDGTQSSYDYASHTLSWQNGQTSVTASQAVIDLVIQAAKLTMTPESALLQIGPVQLAMTTETALLTIGASSVLVDAQGIHFTGPKVDHQGRVISTA